MRIPELDGSGRRRYQVSVGRKPDIGSQTKVVVIVIRNSFADNALKDQAVLGVTQSPNARKRSSDSEDMPAQIRDCRVRDDAAYVAKECGTMQVAMLVLIAIKANQVRKLRR